MFGKISEIDINDTQSFQKIFLTFDIDWASDEVLEYCLEIVEKAKVKATWFATHKTPLLKRILENPLFELGIHPNFNPLLEGNFCYGKNYKEVLEYYLEIVPNAKVMRSHSLAHSSRILIEAKNLGITHESNICIPCVAFEDGGGGALLPYLNWDGLIRCPYHWADDIACMYKNKINIKDIRRDKYFVFGFHPIHIYLNTESLERYEIAKAFTFNIDKLKSHANHSNFGSLNYLEQLI
ncbi:hypothetical protein HPMG_01372 [Helicobacter pullorum MIT 98-5489]|uniref:YdjC-like protein n=2 Tax=Helicobacter pullorum TaxID=35818 RepID=C5F111_9HELI|nr:hypothetical protein [Helicobacter pullorum]EEQ63915.1 hypothetical protein HPMG_01372 [Helicobacter pullorum MIT 98-5489]